jgi:hypothetical protein
MEMDPYQFERDVGDLYRALGTEVQHDVMLAGIQIDLLVKESTSSGSRVTRLVECKAYASRVGLQPVRNFAMTSVLLRDRRLAEAATMVSTNGFTAQARLAADEFGIELLELSDLQARTEKRDIAPRENTGGDAEASPSEPCANRNEDRPAKAFVALPFTPQYDDIYLLGIRAAAEVVGVSVERADDNLVGSSDIVEYIKARIVGSDFVIADTTEQNPNVFYELGFSDGKEKPTFLIAATSTELPFDLRGRNHLLYENIGALRDGLISRLPHFRDLTKHPITG